MHKEKASPDNPLDQSMEMPSTSSHALAAEMKNKEKAFKGNKGFKRKLNYKLIKEQNQLRKQIFARTKKKKKR